MYDISWSIENCAPCFSLMASPKSHYRDIRNLITYDFKMKIGRNKNILRFQVSVDYPSSMEILKCLHYLRSVEDCELDGQFFLIKLFYQFGESAPLYVLIDKVEVFLVLNIHISF